MRFFWAKKLSRLYKKMKSSTTFFVVILLALFVWLQYKLWFSPDGIPQFWQLKKTIAELNNENTVLQQRNDKVAAEIEDLKDGTDAVEERARKDLGLVKPNEVYYQIVP
jgi:cell division protein FtsB